MRAILLVFCIASAFADGPCSTENIKLTCNDVRSGDGLRHFLHDQKTKVVVIANTFGALPTGLFTNAQHMIQLRFLNIKLSQPLTEDTLVGLEDQVSSLNMEQVAGLSTWKWDAFSNLRSLSSVEIMDSEFPYISADFSELTSGSVTKLLIKYCGVRCIDDWAFATFGNVKYLDLSDNKISRLRRDIFPINSTMEMLDLSNNEISDLEEFLFLELTNLRTIYLSGNRLKMIWQKSFGKYTDFQRYLFVVGNPDLMCDCSMKFLKMRLIGTCRTATDLYELDSYLKSEICARYIPKPHNF